MLFNSFQFAVFLPIVFILYWALPHKYRNPLLLIASYYFYMSWNPRLIVLILLTTTVAFLAAKYMSKGYNKKIILSATIFVCIGTLVFFKYFNFLSVSLTSFLRAISLPINDITLNLLLPVGISFYTFQTLSYVIDVYNGKIQVEENFFTFALYVSFFPQLVAGPIERPENLLPQFKEKHIFNYEMAMQGMKRIAVGAFKKIVIADTLAKYVDLIYNDVGSYTGLSLIIATLFFTIQIYCDFSGYSEIARGTANILGFKLMENFKTPYFSASISEFWNRWHISLSSWFKDYVYIPLGGNRVSKSRHYFNLFATFLLSGLWHGANWTFVFWGAYHGFLNVIEVTLKKMKVKPIKVPKIFKIAFIFVLVNIGWVIFRANTLSDAMYIFQNMFTGITSPFSYVFNMIVDFGIDRYNIIYYILPVVVLFIIDFIEYKQGLINFIDKLKKPIKYTLYMVISYVTIFTFLYLYLQGAEQVFIYFQF